MNPPVMAFADIHRQEEHYFFQTYSGLVLLTQRLSAP
jgi:hypothetical protein